jgi:Galactose oxidase, central domain
MEMKLLNRGLLSTTLLAGISAGLFAEVMTANAGTLNQTSTPPVTIGFRSNVDSKLICTKIEVAGIRQGQGSGYAFTRGQSGPNYNIFATEYRTKPSGVDSFATGHILQKPLMGFAAASNFNFIGNTSNGVAYIFGGRVPISSSYPSGFTNEYFTYKPNTVDGFFNGDGSPVSAASTHMPFPARAGIAAVGIDNGKFFVFGGYDGNGVRAESYIFNPLGNVWTQVADMPLSLQNASVLISGTAADRWIYVVGGTWVTNANSNENRKIFRYSVASNQWITLKSSGTDIQLPPQSDTGNKVSIASVQGAMLILTEAGPWSGAGSGSSMNAYRFTHPTNSSTGNGSIMTTQVFDDPVRHVPRLRDNFEVLRCSPNAWVIGGDYGHGPSFSDKGAFVDKWTRY